MAGPAWHSWNEDCHLVPGGVIFFLSTHAHRQALLAATHLGERAGWSAAASLPANLTQPKNLSKLNKSPLGVVSFHIWLQLSEAQ